MPARLITQTNSGGSARLAANWLSSLHALKIADRAHVRCTDDRARWQLRNYAHALKIPVAEVTRTILENANDTVPEGVHPYGTKHFIRFTLWKLDLLQQLAVVAFEPFLFCDPDVVLLRDPESAFEVERMTAESQSLWFGSDREDYLKPQAAHGDYCTGVIYATRAWPRFWGECYEWLASRMPTTTGVDGPNFIHDQTAANAIISQWNHEPGYLSPELFRNGAHEWSGRPVLIHSNWVIGNDVKEKRLRDAGLWFANDATLTEVGL